MSFDAGAKRGSQGSAGGGPRGSNDQRGSLGDNPVKKDPRGSEDARGSIGSTGAGRVSFQEGQKPRLSQGNGRLSQGAAAGRFPGEIAGELDYYGQMEEEMLGEDCLCDDCVCPPEDDTAPEVPITAPAAEDLDTYQLDEFMRAKSYFQQVSAKSGLSMYDHLSEVIRKFLDERAPNNPVDYLEEVSMNVKRYRFGLKKEDLQDTFFIGEDLLKDAQRLFNYFKQFAMWNADKKEMPEEEPTLTPGGSFQNLLRLQYYSEQVNIGLSREEMYRAALGIKELSTSRSQIGKLRFWGKIWGTQRNYYVVEAELKFGGTDQAMDMWTPKEDDASAATGSRQSDGSVKTLELNAVQTFGRAKDVVFNHEFLQAYSKSSGLPPDKAAALYPGPPGGNQPWEGEGAPVRFSYDDVGTRADDMKWESYQLELMQNFPQSKVTEPIVIPPESDGTGVNRRVFYVCNELGQDWTMLPAVTPQMISASRSIRWFLTGNLDSPIKSIPAFPGKEGHYLKALLVRITAGAMCSPKGYYRARPGEELPGEEDDDELEGEDGEAPRAGNDSVQPVKKYKASMKTLTNPNLLFWVHHTGYVLTQGRATWWNPASAKQKQRGTSEYESEAENSEYEGEDDEEEDIEIPGKEVGPPLFKSISEDTSIDKTMPWTLITSSSVFPEFQVVSVRSNTWPGSFALCTTKGKVANLYFGDGLKFAPISFVPQITLPVMKEFKFGPELDETQDPSTETEQNWLSRLALKEAERAEAEAGATTGEEEEDASEYET